MLVSEKTPWTEAERALLRTSFARHLALNTLPGKRETDKFIQDAGMDRPWKNIKYYVRHMTLRK